MEKKQDLTSRALRSLSAFAHRRSATSRLEAMRTRARRAAPHRASSADRRSVEGTLKYDNLILHESFFMTLTSFERTKNSEKGTKKLWNHKMLSSFSLYQHKGYKYDILNTMFWGRWSRYDLRFSLYRPMFGKMEDVGSRFYLILFKKYAYGIPRRW